MLEEIKRKSWHQQAVEDFMGLAGQNVPSKPKDLDAATAELRIRLMLEEVLETANAAGVTVTFHGECKLNSPVTNHITDFSCERTHEFDLVEFVDGCCDTLVVTTGSLSAAGIPDSYPMQLVDWNNLTKFGPGHSIDEHGKLIKPKTHQSVHADLATFVRLLTV